MALGQALSWKSYLEALRAQGLGRASMPAGVMLFGLEVVAAAGLAANPQPLRVTVAWLGVAVTVGWATVALQAFVRRRKVPNCACFGGFLAQELRWWVLLEDAAFVGLAAWHLRNVLIP